MDSLENQHYSDIKLMQGQFTQVEARLGPD